MVSYEIRVLIWCWVNCDKKFCNSRHVVLRFEVAAHNTLISPCSKRTTALSFREVLRPGSLLLFQEDMLCLFVWLFIICGHVKDEDALVVSTYDVATCRPAYMTMPTVGDLIVVQTNKNIWGLA